MSLSWHVEITDLKAVYYIVNSAYMVGIGVSTYEYIDPAYSKRADI